MKDTGSIDRLPKPTAHCPQCGYAQNADTVWDMHNRRCSLYYGRLHELSEKLSKIIKRENSKEKS